jgi:hypothetical protein
MTKKDNYLCIRCGFSTKIKNDIRRHFYNLKKICPATKNNIELTDEIKEYILNNRIYIIPKPQKPEKPTIINNINNQIINNYNQINNLIMSMDPIEKINKYIKYKNIELVDIDERLNETFESKANKLKNNKFKYFHLNLQSIIGIIDEITTIKDINTLNIFYDNILNKIKIFCDNEWLSLLLDFGIITIIDKIQYAYLNSYECYLIRKIINENNYHSKQELKEILEEYYKFLAWFDIQPYIFSKNNNKILFNDNDDKYYESSNNFTIYNDYYKLYTNIISKINKTEQAKVKKGIESIIKKNTKSFIIELNKKYLESLQNDEEFKKDFIKSLIN